MIKDRNYFSRYPLMIKDRYGVKNLGKNLKAIQCLVASYQAVRLAHIPC